MPNSSTAASYCLNGQRDGHIIYSAHSSSVLPSRTSDSYTRTRMSASSKFSLLSLDETAQKLGTSLTHGLSQSEALRRLRSCGPNEILQEDSEALWVRFLMQFKESLILLLLGSASVSFIMGNFDDAISIAVAVTIVVTVGFVQEYRSERSLKALNNLVPHFAHAIRDGVQQKYILPFSVTNKVPSNTGHNTTNCNGYNNHKHDSNNIGKNLVEQDHATHAVSLPASHLVPGDLVIFSTGDRIPADVRIVNATDLTIDESNLTGENEPIVKTNMKITTKTLNYSNTILNNSPPNQPNEGFPYKNVPDLQISDKTNIGFMGTLVRSGNGSGIVVATGFDTEFGVISSRLKGIESPRTPLQLSMDRLGKDLSYASFGIICFIMILGLWRGWAFLEMFTIGVSLAVAAIPEGLPIIVTVTLALGVLRMSKRGAIIRQLPSVETLSGVNIICCDKTGTLTTNHMTATKIWHFSPEGSTIEPVPVSIKQESTYSSSKLDFATKSILRIGNIANDARPIVGGYQESYERTSRHDKGGNEQLRSKWTGHPTDVALLDLIDSFGDTDVRDRIGERLYRIPFRSERKWMGCVINSSNGNFRAHSTAYMKGAVEKLLPRCSGYIDTNGRKMVMNEHSRKEVLSAAESMAKEGLRVLGFASGMVNINNNSGIDSKDEVKKNVMNKLTEEDELTASISPSVDNEYLYDNLEFAGLVGMRDPPRPNVDKAISRLMKSGIRIIMITGDSDITAMAIARKLGIVDSDVKRNYILGGECLRGDQIDSMNDHELRQAVTCSSVFARTNPVHKMKIIRAFQSRGDVVAMTGDGVNDAPALKKADIGISMGKYATDVAKEAADMILTDDHFETILHAIEEGKGIFYNIQNFLTFQLSMSAAALGLVMVSTIAGYRNPLNAMQILWINILMDGPPAQSLGVEPVDKEVFKLPPRSKTARVLTHDIIRKVFISSLITLTGTFIIYLNEMHDKSIITARDTTMTFTCFVLFGMFNALACRSKSKSILLGQVHLFGSRSNKMFNWAILGCLMGQCLVIYFPPLQLIFETQSIGLFDWLKLIALTSSVFWLDEFIKIWRSWKSTVPSSSPHDGNYSVNV